MASASCRPLDGDSFGAVPQRKTLGTWCRLGAISIRRVRRSVVGKNTLLYSQPFRKATNSTVCDTQNGIDKGLKNESIGQQPGPSVTTGPVAQEPCVLGAPRVDNENMKNNTSIIMASSTASDLLQNIKRQDRVSDKRTWQLDCVTYCQ